MSKSTLLIPDTRASRTNAVSERTRRTLWARAAGRCQYAACNKSLIGDLISGAEDRNFGFVAHIVADSPRGPRGDAARSALLSDDVNNLMLLCHVHHKLIDVDEREQHPEDRLLAMKAAHETRVDVVTAIHENRGSHVVRYAANVGNHESPLEYDQIATAMLPERYPAEGRRTIDIELRGTDHRDHEPQFWKIQSENLQRQFSRKVRDRIEAREVGHLSVFALAPQPLLMELGRLLCDIVPVDVYQLHREPQGWRWPGDSGRVTFRVRRPESAPGPVALVLALSGTVKDRRIVDVLGHDARIWAIEAQEPHNDALKRREDLTQFRRLVRSMLNQIKAAHGEREVIHVFPALPVSAAIEVGRVWMPKADLPLVVYDQNRALGGFGRALEIGDSGPAAPTSVNACTQKTMAPSPASSTG